MRRTMFAILAVAISMAAAAAETPPASVLTTEGLGPVKIGMTLTAAETALGARLKITYAEDADTMGCGMGRRADGRIPDVYYMVDGGRIVRIDVGIVGGATPSRPPVRSAKNVGVESTEAEVRRAYGRDLVIEPHPYGGEQDHYLIVKTPDGKRGLIFETANGKVTSFRAGLYDWVGYSEGCS